MIMKKTVEMKCMITFQTHYFFSIQGKKPYLILFFFFAQIQLDLISKQLKSFLCKLSHRVNTDHMHRKL